LVAVFFASDRSVHLMLGFSLFFTLAVMAFVAYDKVRHPSLAFLLVLLPARKPMICQDRLGTKR
jgi:hypothetical protein